MATARVIIRKALQKAGILSKTEQPSADEASDALDALNDLFASVANDTLMTTARHVELFDLTSGKAEYTIGSGGDFNTDRPTYIASAFIRSGTVDYPVTLISDTSYDREFSVKTTGSIPEFMTYDNGYPLGEIVLYPAPVSGYKIGLRMEKPISNLDLDDEVELPPGWNMYLIYQLAVLLAPEYGQPIDPAIRELANEAKNSIMTTAMRNRTMDAAPVCLGSGFDIYTSRFK